MHNPQELQLAQEIAERLNDPDSFNQFLRYTQKYSHKLLREKLNYVSSVPERKILTSRAAYFVFLIEQLDYSHNPDDREHNDVPVRPTVDDARH